MKPSNTSPAKIKALHSLANWTISSRSSVLWLTFAVLWILGPSKLFAQPHYSQTQIDDIASFASNHDKLRKDQFEDALRPLISPADQGNSELARKLISYKPEISKEGIQAVLDVAKQISANIPQKVPSDGKPDKAVAKQAAAKKAQQRAALKARALTEAHNAAAAAHSKAKSAADAAKTAHENAARSPADPSLANDAAIKDQEAAVATQKSSTADLDPALKAPTEPTNSMWSVWIWSGAKLQNPYSITNGVIKPNNTRTDGFVDLELVHRYVLSSDSYGNDNLFYKWFNVERKFGDGTWDFFAPGQVFPDLDFRVGYVFAGSSTPTNLTVSTIAGGSDFYSDNSMGMPFWRWSHPGSWDQQATIELGGGFVTDKNFLDIHPNYFVGLGYQFHNKDWFWQNRFGLGAADVPRLRGGANLVSTNTLGLALFDLKQAPSWGTQITYSLSAAIKVQVGANAYFDKRAAWNLSAGLSVEPVSLFSSFVSKK